MPETATERILHTSPDKDEIFWIIIASRFDKEDIDGCFSSSQNADGEHVLTYTGDADFTFSFASEVLEEGVLDKELSAALAEHTKNLPIKEWFGVCHVPGDKPDTWNILKRSYSFS
jgi:hypothetical protein